MIVDPERRGSGTGTALLEAAVARCRDMRFELVYLWTHDMQDWYAQLGWEKVEERSFRNVSITIFKLDPIL
jgi:N-acetylglutamate synthase-like GNAT family acetyltransferase